MHVMIQHNERMKDWKCLFEKECAANENAINITTRIGKETFD